MDIVSDIDWIVPFDIQVVYRSVGIKEPPDAPLKDFLSELTLTWDMIDAIQTYPHEDLWEGDCQGPKYYLHLSHGLGCQVVLGDVYQMKQSWQQYLKFCKEEHDRSTGY